jgi:hypothetical protein
MGQTVPEQLAYPLFYIRRTADLPPVADVTMQDLPNELLAVPSMDEWL